MIQAGFEPELGSVLGTELTAFGWRGVTNEGEILEVHSRSGVPESITMVSGGKPLGQRTVSQDVISVSDYLDAFNKAVQLHRENRNDEALATIDLAISIAPTLRARFNRAMILLALDDWLRGFTEFELCERHAPFIRPNAIKAAAFGGAPWRGESLDGKRLLVIHDHGFGDTLMCLRFIKTIRSKYSCQIRLSVPQELRWIAAQFASPDAEGCDYFTSFLHLLRWLEIEPHTVPVYEPYIAVDSGLQVFWKSRLSYSRRWRVGVAWSIGNEVKDDFPRSLPLQQIVSMYPDADLHSVQKQGAEEAAALGVIVHDPADFSSAAALMANMDEIVSVDTAAVHLAGAIGHPHVKLLLPQWHSWRWHGNPFYPRIRIAQSGR